MVKKIILFGCQAISIDVLRFLHSQRGVEISKVITYEVPSDLSLGQESIKTVASDLGIEAISPCVITMELINEIRDLKPDLIISSYHGIPKSYFKNGDPYHCYCHKTTRLLKEKFSKIEIQTTFQSRFGPQEWLTPYTDKTLEILPGTGVKNLLVICPGFASDCVETLEEINIQGKKSFLSNGGKNFDLIPCLNDSPSHIYLLEKLITKYL